MKLLSIIFIIFIILVTMNKAIADQYNQKPKLDEVAISHIGVEIPQGNIILIRKENYYCALKFLSSWREVDEERLKVVDKYIRKGGVTAESARESAQKSYATYESYFQQTGIPNFTDERIERKDGTASLLPLRGPFRPFVYQPGNGIVECGRLKLMWFYKTVVSFIPPGKSSSMRDFGIELAPTPWIDIKEINIKDSRIKWYRYDENRQKEFIPIDRLWGK